MKKSEAKKAVGLQEVLQPLAIICIVGAVIFLINTQASDRFTFAYSRGETTKIGMHGKHHYHSQYFEGPFETSKSWGERATDVEKDYYGGVLPYISSDALALPIELPNVTLNPLNHEALVGSGFHNDYVPGMARLFIVQYKQPLTEIDYMTRQPVARMNENVYIFQLSVSELEQLVTDPNVNFLENYHPHYKLDPEVYRSYYEQEVDPSKVFYITVADFMQSSEAQSEMQALAELASVTGPMQDATGKMTFAVSGLTDRKLLFNFALHPKVIEISLE